MLLAYFDSKGVIYTDYVPRGKTVNSQYIIESLGRFLKIYKDKRSARAGQDWFLHWDNAPVHSAAVVQQFLANQSIKTIAHPPYSPDLAPADFFLFPQGEKQPGWQDPDPGHLQKQLGGGHQEAEQRRLRHRLREVDRSLRKVCAPRGQLC